MGLRDRLDVRGSGGICTVRLLLEMLDVETAGELTELIADPTVPATSLARLAQAEGWALTPGSDSFQRHRRKDCKCH